MSSEGWGRLLRPLKLDGPRLTEDEALPMSDDNYSSKSRAADLAAQGEDVMFQISDDNFASESAVLYLAAEDPTPITSSQTPEPFSKHSELCLDGQIHNLSEHLVASGGCADVWTGSLGVQTVAIKVMRYFSSHGDRIKKDKLLKVGFVIRLLKRKPTCVQRLWREYLAWSCLCHPNVLKCLGFSYDFTRGSQYEIPSLISHWMPNGTVSSYIETHRSADRLKLVSEQKYFPAPTENIGVTNR
jgi:hypothetical protein